MYHVSSAGFLYDIQGNIFAAIHLKSIGDENGYEAFRRLAKFSGEDASVTWVKEDRNNAGRSVALARLDYPMSASQESFIFLGGSHDRKQEMTGNNGEMDWVGAIMKFDSDGTVKNMVELEF